MGKASGAGPVQLVELSLVSMQPVSVKCGAQDTLWEVGVSLSGSQLFLVKKPKLLMVPTEKQERGGERGGLPSQARRNRTTAQA